jgi:hypothetical protein
MIDNPQAHGYRRAVHPGEGLNTESTGRKVERNVWILKDVIERRDKENLRMSGSYSHKLCLYCSYGVIV